MKSVLLIICLLSSISASMFSCSNTGNEKPSAVAAKFSSEIEDNIANKEIEEDEDKLGYDFTVLDSSFIIPYLLDEPDTTFKLPGKLEEISGLSLSENRKKLFAVQDEKGKIFTIDKETGKVDDDKKFWKEGDYEGIEAVGEIIYVVKSTGTIYEVQHFETDTQNVVKYNFFLSRENDVEGLGYDKANNRLLIACKGLPGTGESFEVARFKKVVYAFDLKTKEIIEEPAFTITLDAIHQFLNTSYTEDNLEKLMSYFNPEQNLTFNPSALAVHPKTKNIYILSSTKKLLVILSPEGDIVMMKKMSKKVHRQPEGIAFDDDGTLYISNEGKGGTARIHRFGYVGE